MRTLITPILPLAIILLPCILFFFYSQQIKTKVSLKVTIAGILFLLLGLVLSWIAMLVFIKISLKQSQPYEGVCLTGIELMPLLGWIFNIVGITTLWLVFFISEKKKQTRIKIIAKGQNKDMDFHGLMVKKSDNELENYLINIMAYSREIVEAAITELRNRGRVFTEAELSTLETKIQERENTIGKNTITVRDSLEKNIVEDESALALYSRKTIDWTTLIFGIVVGSILMVLNFKSAEKKKGIFTVLIFGTVYLLLEIFILSLIPDKTSSFVNLARLGLNGLGAFIIHTLIWDKFIGKDLKYRKKPIWLPIILGIIMEGLFFLLWLYS